VKLKSASTFAELLPNEIVRLFDGPKYFGLKPTALNDAISKGLIPRPMALTVGGRAKGWTGAQVIAHQTRLFEAKG
jgi:hypothetical protein